MAFIREEAGKWVLSILRRLVRDPAAWGLVILNLVAGAVILRHPPYTDKLFLLYWCDCVLIGAFGALKLVFVPIRLGTEAERRSIVSFVLRGVARIFLAGFFLFAYGFVLACVTAMLGGIAGEEARIRPDARLAEGLFPREIWIPIGLLLAGHLVSFVRNFLGKAEYRTRTAEEQLAGPFGRVLPLFFILAVGGMALSLFRRPYFLVVIFVLAKTAADLAGHAWEHRPSSSCDPH